MGSERVHGINQFHKKLCLSCLCCKRLVYSLARRGRVHGDDTRWIADNGGAWMDNSEKQAILSEHVGSNLPLSKFGGGD